MSEIDKKIVQLRDEWYAAFRAIYAKRCDMEWLNGQAEEALKESVDSVMTAEELGAMLVSFEKKRFGSTLVKKFLKTLCDKTFPDNAEWRKNVNCVGIDGQYSCNQHGNVYCDISSINITFSDAASNKIFKLVVPVKENIWVDFARQSDPGMGKYMLLCAANRKHADIMSAISNPLVIVAIVSKANNIKDALDNFMSGKFDSEIEDASAIDVTCFKTYNFWKKDQYDSYHDDIENLSPTSLLFKALDEHNVIGFDGWRDDPSYKYIKNLVAD